MLGFFAIGAFSIGMGAIDAGIGSSAFFLTFPFSFGTGVGLCGAGPRRGFDWSLAWSLG
jgi:hypothetical protein